MEGLEAQVATFIKDSCCVLVEPSRVFVGSIQQVLKALGVPPDKIHVAAKFEDARQLVSDLKPRILITEFNVQDGSGLSLIEIQEQFYKDTERIAVVVTKNSSDSAVAEAAEEQVDAFILKPFSADGLKKKLQEAFTKKINPNEYLKTIREGKEYLTLKEFDIAGPKFVSAKGLDPKPTLAYYYSGETSRAKGDIQSALAEFQKGRELHPLHYKCLIGEFEAYMDLKDYEKAYELVSLIRSNFPVTSHRLGQMLIATVFTKHFDDLNVLMERYSALEHRTPYLVNLATAALLAAGRFAIVDGDFARALHFFEMGLTVSARNPEYIEKVINELCKANAVEEAQAFFGKIRPPDVGKEIYERLSFRIAEFTLSPEALVEKGRKLILAGYGTPDIFRFVVRKLVDLGKATLAETIILKAVETHPELRGELYAILESGPSGDKASA